MPDGNFCEIGMGMIGNWPIIGPFIGSFVDTVGDKYGDT
jgi:hypothetical protein